MSMTKAALYDELDGRYVDAVTEEHRAQELWLTYPGRRDGHAIGMQRAALLEDIDNRIAQVRSRISMYASRLIDDGTDPSRYMMVPQMGWVIRRMSMLRLGLDHLWSQRCAIEQGWHYTPRNYNGSAA